MATPAVRESKAKSRYGNPPKIKAKGGTTSAPAGEAPKKSPGDAPTSTATPSPTSPGSAPAADVMAGTDGIDVTTRHAAERDEVLQRHMTEMQDMHKRHQKDHETMTLRHTAEMGGGGAPEA